MVLSGDVGSDASCAGFAGAILVWGEASKGAVEAPSDEDGGRSPPPS